MSRSTLFLAAIAVGVLHALALPTASAQDAEKVLLQWKFREGSTIHFVVEQTGSVNVAGGTGQTAQTLDMEWRVKKVDADSKAQIEQAIQRLRMSLDMPPFGKVNYDSKNAKPKDPISAAIAKTASQVVGKKFLVEMTPEGAVTTSEPPPKKNAGRPKKPGAKEEVAAGGGELAMWRSVIAEASIPLPAEPIAPGHRWSRESTLELPEIGKQKIATSFHYVGPTSAGKGTLHKIEVRSEIRGEEGQRGMQVEKHQGTGAIYFDAERGMLDHGEMEQTTTVKLGNPAIGGGTYDVVSSTKIRRED